MFPSDANYLVLSDEEKIKKTDDFFEKILAKKDRILKESKELVSKINDVLKNGGDEKCELFFQLIEDDKYYECISYSYDLNCLKIWKPISILEKERHEDISLLNRSSFEDMRDTFQRVLFYIHRIEFDFPIELQEQLFDFMRKEHVSPVFLFYVINSDLIYRKTKIGIQLAALFERQGNEVWSLFFLQWARNRMLKKE